MSTPVTSLFKASLGRKWIMALTGLFLCTFLVGHLAGNLQLFIPGEEGKIKFNDYAYFMTHNPLVKALSYLTYASVIFHVIDGIILTIRNKKARPVKYHTNKPAKNSAWSSRNMGILGTMLLVFIVVHMCNWWYVMHFGELRSYTSPETGHTVKDLHESVVTFFDNSINEYAYIYIVLYVVSMFALGFHLLHGFQSGFQSLGINHPVYTPVIKFVGTAFAIVVPGLFASIPVYLFIASIIS